MRRVGRVRVHGETFKGGARGGCVELVMCESDAHDGIFKGCVQGSASSWSYVCLTFMKGHSKVAREWGLRRVGRECA